MLKPLTADIKPDRTALSLAAYEAAGGYQGLRKALAQTPIQVQQAVTASGLRGRGGAVGFDINRERFEHLLPSPFAEAGIQRVSRPPVRA